MKITRGQLKQIIRESILSEKKREPAEYDDMVGVEIPDNFGGAREDPAAAAAALVRKDVEKRAATRDAANIEKIAKLKDKPRKKEYFYRFEGDVMQGFDKESGEWMRDGEPDDWTLDMKIGTLNKDMQQPMRDMIGDLNGANWNLKELSKYHYKTNPMPEPGSDKYEEFKKKAYTPGAEGAWTWKTKIHRGWRDHKTQAELNAKGTGASSSLHTVLDRDGQPASLAADVIDRRYAWSGSKSPEFFNALRIAAHSTGKLQIDIPIDDPAHVIHADYKSTQAKSIDAKTQKVMASLKSELEAAEVA
jgi:hypothetical protein